MGKARTDWHEQAVIHSLKVRPMELIPVFSLIVLVATIGTFILAVGAYIMFRLRESRHKGNPTRASATYEADVYAPQPVEPPADGSVGGIVRREHVRDPRLMQIQRDPVDPDENSPSSERRKWR